MVTKDKIKECDEYITAKYSGKQLMDKLDLIHEDIHKLDKQVATTNGKVKFHSKMLWSLWSIIITLAIAYLTTRA